MREVICMWYVNVDDPVARADYDVDYMNLPCRSSFVSAPVISVPML